MYLRRYEVARLLRVSENSIFRMIRSKTIPCLKKRGEWQFKRGEILAWPVDAKEVAVKRDWENNLQINEERIHLSELLKRGVIYYGVKGDTREAIIKESLSDLKCYTNQSFINKLIEAAIEREKLCSTAIGYGIALPHPGPFEGYLSQVPSISLFFFERPVPCGELYRIMRASSFSYFSGNKVRFL